MFFMEEEKMQVLLFVFLIKFHYFIIMLLLTNIPHFAKLNTKTLRPRKSFGLEKNHININIYIEKGHVMVFACKYFNSKHKHIS
jgi:hypothetical protein